ncbi:hypothetical protein A5634_14365 [Mycobacterium asiaticum]|uniref:DUF6542 domain-containing protein n=1 Tax=Mycobacterium asiaticum TaxID=1790 RepID=A0A1A3PFP3_MYCAS|nr:hypothetical protein A5634_14365 [Mycobacterium asiaticum]
MEPSHRSIVPNIAGVPWWAAVLVAVGLTAVGYAFDAGHKELTHTFAGFYIAGCVAAILAVRQAAVFTAVIQPPLILFCTVPGAYWLFHGGKVDKFKDLLINCGYPLIERFPLMLGTAGLVLFIGLIRWYFGKNSRTAATADKAMDSTAAKEDATARPSFISGLVAKVSSLLAGDTADDDSDAAADAPPAHAKRRAASSSRAGRTASRSAQRPARSRSRHARPDDSLESDGDRPRRAARRSTVPREYADYDPADPPPRPRRRRPPGDDELGAPPPREMRREPHPRRNPYERSYERPERRSSRFDPYESYDRPEPSERGERRSRHERRGGGYEPYPPYEPRSRRAAPSGSTSNPTHHPISQVRYRGQPPYSEPRDEPRSDRRSRSPRSSSRRPQTETWEYDS